MSSRNATFANWLRLCFFLLWIGLFTSQSLIDAAASLLFLSAVFDFARSPERRLQAFRAARCSWLTWLCVAWAIVIFVGLFFVAPPDADRWTNFLEFRWMIELGLWAAMLRHAPPRRTDLPWILAPVAINAIYGLVTWATGLDPFTHNEFTDRVGGLFGNPMPFAHNMGPVAAGLLAAGLVYWREGRTIKPWYWAVGALVWASVLFSFTRGIWAGLLVAAVVVPWVIFPRKGWRVSLAAVIAAAALCFVPAIQSRITQSFDPQRSYDGERAVLWRTNLEIFRDHPIVGVGYGQNRNLLRQYFDRDGVPAGQFESHAHNQYLHFLAGTGALGLLCYALFLAFFLVESARQIRHPNGDLWIDALSAGLFAAQIVFDIGSFTESNFSIAKNRALLIFAMALVLLIRNVRRAQAPARPV